MTIPLLLYIWSSGCSKHSWFQWILHCFIASWIFSRRCLQGFIFWMPESRMQKGQQDIGCKYINDLDKGSQILVNSLPNTDKSLVKLTQKLSSLYKKKSCPYFFYFEPKRQVGGTRNRRAIWKKRRIFTAIYTKSQGHLDLACYWHITHTTTMLPCCTD